MERASLTRLMVVQYAGDYRDAYRRLSAEGEEVYFGHGYVLEQLAMLTRKYGEVGIMCCLAPKYSQALPSGVTVMGAGSDPYRNANKAIAQIAEYGPTHLVIQGPIAPFLRWGIRQRIRVGCVLADSFATHPLYRQIRFGRLPGLLNHPNVSLVANHGINAAKGLVALGVRADKVMAWDFPHRVTPDQFSAKLPPSGPTYRIVYVVSIEPKKGIGDLIRAVALLRHRLDLRVDIAGAGRREEFARLAQKLGISDKVNFLGLIPNSQILPLMRSADAVVVPSRHEFPEGLPLTLYEALASRTPTIASDHPMFHGHLEHGKSAYVFPASRPAALAAGIMELFGDPALYASISAGAAEAWQHMQTPVKWGDMLDRWISDKPSDRQWLRSNVITPQLDVEHFEGK